MSASTVVVESAVVAEPVMVVDAAREQHYAALKERYAVAVSWALQQGTATAMHGISYESLAWLERDDARRAAEDEARWAAIHAAEAARAAKPLSKKQQRLAEHRAKH